MDIQELERLFKDVIKALHNAENYPSELAQEVADGERELESIKAAITLSNKVRSEAENAQDKAEKMRDMAIAQAEIDVRDELEKRRAESLDKFNNFHSSINKRVSDLNAKLKQVESDTVKNIAYLRDKEAEANKNADAAMEKYLKIKKQLETIKQSL